MPITRRVSTFISAGNFIWVGIGIAFLYWFLESFIHVLFFGVNCGCAIISSSVCRKPFTFYGSYREMSKEFIAKRLAYEEKLTEFFIIR